MYAGVQTACIAWVMMAYKDILMTNGNYGGHQLAEPTAARRVTGRSTKKGGRAKVAALARRENFLKHRADINWEK